MARIAEVLDRVHARVYANPLAYRLTVGTRLLLAVGFIPTGLVKLLGQPFTSIDPSTDVGLFFHALHQTGLYWRFLGASQVAASVLLLIPATATLGALLFLPIIANIFVITVSMHFAGTPVITGLMLLATVWLVAWDYPRWRGVLFPSRIADAPQRPAPLAAAERICYLVGGAAGLVVFGMARIGAPPLAAVAVGLAAALAAVVLGLRQAVLARRRARRP